MNRVSYILDDDRQRAITKAMAKPTGPSLVIWDFILEAWGLECGVCAQRRVVRPDQAQLTHGEIRNILLAAAERHNRDKHGKNQRGLGKMKFICLVCHQSYKDLGELWAHLRSHGVLV